MRIGVATGAVGVPDALVDVLEAAGLPAAGLRTASTSSLVSAGDTTWVPASGADVLAGCVRGALDAGIVGKDLLLEEDPDVYELLDLGVGADAIVYATPRAATPGRERSRPRVATPYPRVTRRHFGANGRQVEAVGFAAAALAPALGIAEGVVDLRSRVAGAPLDLEVREEVAAVSLRLVAGRAAHALLADGLVALLERLRPSLEG
ncbi:MAG: ATP phosphoribosyltransferase [Actinomycetes bacterium]